MHPEYFNKQGTKVPSVTTVMKIMTKPGIIEWANLIGKQGKTYGPYLNELAVYGTCNHNAIEALLMGKPQPIIINDKMEKEIKESVRKVKLLVDDLHLTNCQTELSLTSAEFGGTMDLIADMQTIDGKVVKLLGDFKTSKKVYSSHFLQLGGYLELLRLTKPDIFKSIEVCAIILIKHDKVGITYMPKELCYNTFTPLFLKLLELYKLHNAVEYMWPSMLDEAITKQYK